MQKGLHTWKDLKMVLDRITDGFIVLDKDFRYTYVNARIGELVHRDPQSLIGKNVWEEFPDAVGSLTYKAFQTAFKEQRFIGNIDYYAPLDLWQENHIYPSPEGLSIFIKDITDKKKLEKELRDKERNQQFEIMVSALEAQEKERTFIGQELHDNVNQLLVATRLMLTLIRDNPEAVKKGALSNCVVNLEKAIAANRRISHELITPDVNEESLVELIRMLVHDMLTENGIKVSIKASRLDTLILDEHKKLTLYRIAQEQCINILKHAEASHVRMELGRNEDDFVMTISDNGKGVRLKDHMRGIGLKNMEARLSVFKGRLYLESAPGKGFFVEVRMPVGNGYKVKAGSV